MKDTIVKLNASYVAGDKNFSEIKLREPTFREVYMDGLGRPQDWQPTPNGPMMITYPSVIDEYLQKIILEPGYEYVSQLTALDSLKLGAAVCGFFRDTTTSET